ncbi:hypothetical protein FHX03_002387 [Rhizobium sp. BK456]|nr:hypothetical protein [Rhizobium sp. BK456]
MVYQKEKCMTEEVRFGALEEPDDTWAIIDLRTGKIA